VGSHRSPLRGFSTEFAHHRQYSPGDAIRDIDWRVFGRTERYYTKLYEAETNFDCHLLIDASASMTYASGKVSKLEYAKFLAAALAYIVLKQRDSVGLSIFDSRCAHLPPRSTMGMILQIDRLLREAKAAPTNTIAKQLHDIALMMNRRSFVIVISDLLADVDDILAGLDHLRFDGHNVVVLHTLDPYEIEFPVHGHLAFDGLELEEPLTTQPSGSATTTSPASTNTAKRCVPGCNASPYRLRPGRHVPAPRRGAQRVLPPAQAMNGGSAAAARHEFPQSLLLLGALGIACRSSPTCSTASR
jgi:uncharacterized protein (DUF58 family)